MVQAARALSPPSISPGPGAHRASTWAVADTLGPSVATLSPGSSRRSRRRLPVVKLWHIIVVPSATDRYSPTASAAVSLYGFDANASDGFTTTIQHIFQSTRVSKQLRPEFSITPQVSMAELFVPDITFTSPVSGDFPPVASYPQYPLYASGLVFPSSSANRLARGLRID